MITQCTPRIIIKKILLFFARYNNEWKEKDSTFTKTRE